MHVYVCMYVCMWVVCVLKLGKIRGSRRQPHGATPPRRRGDGRPPPLPPHPTCWRALGRPPCPQPAAALTHEHWRAAKRSLGGKKRTYGQMCGDTQANYRGQRLTWAQSRTIPNYMKYIRTVQNGSGVTSFSSSLPPGWIPEDHWPLTWQDCLP